jgi:hypothetical protein
MRRSAAPLFRSFAIAVLVALPIAQIGACGGETGVTPSCVPNVSDSGIQTNVDNGCTGFAICDKNPKDARACCKSEDGGTLSDGDLALCLFGYGQGPAPSAAAATTGTGTSTGTGTGTSTSTGTGTGSGGAGGGN